MVPRAAEACSKLQAEDSLRSVGHAKARQVAIREGEQSHDGDEGTVVSEEDEFGVLDVTHHDQRDEDQTRQHGDRKQAAPLRRLQNHHQRNSEMRKKRFVLIEAVCLMNTNAPKWNSPTE